MEGSGSPRNNEECAFACEPQSVLKRETRAGQEPGESPLSGKVVRAAAGGQARSPAYNLRPVSQMKHRCKVSGREAVGPLCPRPRQNAIAFMVGVQAKAGCLEGRDWTQGRPTATGDREEEKPVCFWGRKILIVMLSLGSGQKTPPQNQQGFQARV